MMRKMKGQGLLSLYLTRAFPTRFEYLQTSSGALFHGQRMRGGSHGIAGVQRTGHTRLKR